MPFELIVSILISFILLKTPFIGKYISLIGTLIHEVGHALITLLTFGEVQKIKLFSNSAGEAWSSNRHWISKMLTNIAGYPAASISSYLLLYLIKNKQYEYILLFFIAIFTFSLIFWIRNLYGIFYVITFLSLLSIMIRVGNTKLIEVILLFITCTIWTDSILSSLHIFKASFVDYKNSGDALNLAKATLIIPTPIWGTFFLLQALFFAYKGLLLFM